MRNLFTKKNCSKIVASVLFITFVFSFFANIFLTAPTAFASINKQINYQGKLTNTSNIAVTDGNYNIEFKLYTAPSGGAAIWTEDDLVTNSQGIQLKNGLFSVMLGSTTALTGVNFNQTLYLGVNIGSTTTSPVWDGEMTPRKVLGAVPAAFVADTLQGLTPTQFFRSDVANSTSTASTYFSITNSGSGDIADFVGTSSLAVLTVQSGGNIGIGTSTPTQALTVAGNIVATGTIDAWKGFYTNGLFFGVASGTRNIIIGYPSRGGSVGGDVGTDNFFVGYQAGYVNVSGSNNNFMGSGSGLNNSGGSNNNFLGNSSGIVNTTGSYNNFIGSNAGDTNTTGSNNSFIGASSGYFNSTGSGLVAIGYDSLYNTTAGSSTAIGYNSGVTNSNGYLNTFLGYGADASAGSFTNATAIGAKAIVGASNSLVLGGTGANAVNVGIGTTTPSVSLSVIGNALIQGTNGYGLPALSITGAIGSSTSIAAAQGSNAIVSTAGAGVEYNGGGFSGGGYSFTSGAGGTGQGGGGTFAITLGAGGAGDGANNDFGGTGGSFTVTGGVGGTGGNGGLASYAQGGQGSALSLTAGNGGAAGLSSGATYGGAGGIGGSLSLTTGNGNTGGVSAGSGNVYEGGNGGSAGNFNISLGTGGAGASQIDASNSATIGGNGGNAGSITISPKAGGSGGTAGAMGGTITGGNGGTGSSFTWNGGIGGTGGGASGGGGSITSGNGGVGGSFTITAGAGGAPGSGAVGGNGGIVALQAGVAGSGGVNGYTTIQGAGSDILRLLNLSTTTVDVFNSSGWLGIGSSTPSAKLSIQDNSGLAGTNPLFRIASSTPAGLATTTLFTILGNGNVGIGSTSPASLLTVSGAGYFTGGLTIAGTSSFQNIIPGGPYTGNVSNYNIGASTTRWNSLWANVVNIGSSTWSLAQTGSRFGIFNSANAAGTEALSILSSGYVGIGTTTPQSMLTVAGSADFYSNVLVNGGTGSGNTLDVNGTVNATQYNLSSGSYFYDTGSGPGISTNGAGNFFIDGGYGNLAAGSWGSPGGSVAVNNAMNMQTNTIYGIGNMNFSNGVNQIYTDSYDNFYFQTAGPGGIVAYNPTQSQVYLQTISSTNHWAISTDPVGGGAYSFGIVNFDGGPFVALGFDASDNATFGGNVIIGGGTGSGNALDVNGNINATNATFGSLVVTGQILDNTAYDYVSIDTNLRQLYANDGSTVNLDWATPGSVKINGGTGSGNALDVNGTGNFSHITVPVGGTGSEAYGFNSYISSTSSYSVAIGENTSITGNLFHDQAVAIGYGATTVGQGSTAIGYNAQALGGASTAIGDGAISGSGGYGPSLAIGNSVTAGQYQFVVGNNISNQNYALGLSLTGSGGLIAIGGDSTNSNRGITIGQFNTTSGYFDNYVIGTRYTTPTQNYTASIGTGNDSNHGFDFRLFGADSVSNAGIDMASLVTSWINATDGSQKSRLVLNAYNVATAEEGIRIDATSSGAQVGIGGAVSGTNVLSVNGNSYFSGNVGIGSSSPSSLLTVAGQIFAQNLVTSSTTATSTFAGPVVVNCVTEDTLIRRRRKKAKKSGDDDEDEEVDEDKYEYENVPIVNIEAQDEIESFDEKTNTTVYREVKGLYDMGVQLIWKIETVGGRSIRTTSEHPYYVLNEKPKTKKKAKKSKWFTKPEKFGVWKKVKNLRVGNKIGVISVIDRTVGWDTISAITNEPGQPVFDLEIAGTHTFIANDIIAHNTLVVNGSISVAQASTNAVIIGKTTGNGRGSNAVDIQSSHACVTQVASGNGATAIGLNNIASQIQTLAIGYSNTASGCYSSASGYHNTASGGYSTASGYCNVSSGTNSSVFGSCNTVSGNGSGAFGELNSVAGNGSDALGLCNTVSGKSSVAIGSLNTASTTDSQVFGRSNFTSSGNGTVILGILNNSTGGTLTNSTGAITGTPAATTTVGYSTTAVGICNVTSGNFATAVGYRNFACGISGSAFGYHDTASGCNSAALGFGNTATGNGSSVSGYVNTVCGNNSSAFGYENSVVIDCGTAIGYKNSACGTGSSAFGECNYTCGIQSLSVGYLNMAAGCCSSAIGLSNTVSALNSMAVGYNNCASGSNSLAIGYGICNTCDNTIEIGNSDSQKICINNGQLIGDGSGLSGDANSFCVYCSSYSGYAYCANNANNANCANNSSYSGYANYAGYSNYSNSSNWSSSSGSAYCSCYACTVGAGNSGPNWLMPAYGYYNSSISYGASAIGNCNTASSNYASALGYCNTASGYGSSATGYRNTALCQGSSASGFYNRAYCNNASAYGYSNIAMANEGSAFGYINTASGEGASAFGYYNSASGYYSSADGHCNVASGKDSSASGFYNVASGICSSVFGAASTASGYLSTAVGFCNYAKGTGSSAFGYSNIACCGSSSVFGYANITTSTSSTAVGVSNTVSGYKATAVGFYNIASGSLSVALGNCNTASSSVSSASGYKNIASGLGASAFGDNNLASGSYSSAFGYANSASACLSSAFGSSLSNSVASSTLIGPNNSAAVSIIATGSIGLRGTAASSTNAIIDSSGARLTAGGVWTNASDRNLKENFTSLDSADILAKINELPVTEWNYKVEDPTITHIGPVAQDFYSIFGVGGSDVSISTIDPAGIALVGIQELSKELTGLASTTSTLTASSTNATLDLQSLSTTLASSTASTTAFITNMNNTLASVVASEYSTSTVNKVTDESSMADTLNFYLSGTKQWLFGEVSAVTGYFKNIFADKITANTVKTKELCLDDLCITKDQLQQLLSEQNSSGTPVTITAPSGGPGGGTTPPSPVTPPVTSTSTPPETGTTTPPTTSTTTDPVITTPPDTGTSTPTVATPPEIATTTPPSDVVITSAPVETAPAAPDASTAGTSGTSVGDTSSAAASQ